MWLWLEIQTNSLHEKCIQLKNSSKTTHCNAKNIHSSREERRNLLALLELQQSMKSAPPERESHECLIQIRAKGPIQDHVKQFLSLIGDVQIVPIQQGSRILTPEKARTEYSNSLVDNTPPPGINPVPDSVEMNENKVQAFQLMQKQIQQEQSSRKSSGIAHPPKSGLILKLIILESPRELKQIQNQMHGGQQARRTSGR